LDISCLYGIKYPSLPIEKPLPEKSSPDAAVAAVRLDRADRDEETAGCR